MLYRCSAPRLPWFLSLIFCLSAGLSFASHRIEVQIENYQEKQVFLAYHLWDKQYVKDTASAEPDGSFVFAGEEDLPPGLYMIVLQPDNRLLEVLVDQDQHFTISTNDEATAEATTIIDSRDNQIFYEYLRYLETSNQQAEIYQKKQKDGNENFALYAQKLEELQEEVNQRQRSIAAKYPDSFTAAVIKARMTMDIPNFEGSEERVQYLRWQYAKKHFFDDFDLAEHRMLRTPFYFQRVDYYLNNLIVQDPDSMKVAVDFLVSQAQQGHPENFKVMLINLFNRFASSRTIGFDAVYVYMADHYYRSGKADWVEQATLNQILERSDQLRPLLIGKKAPNFSARNLEGDYFSLSLAAPSDYKVLLFWESNCELCKEQLAALVKLTDQYPPEKVRVLSVLLNEPAEELVQTMKEQQVNKSWQHALAAAKAQELRDRYAIQTQYKIYLLDRRGKILSKDLSSEQLTSYLENRLQSN